jgi:hypothetical protein
MLRIPAGAAAGRDALPVSRLKVPEAERRAGAVEAGAVLLGPWIRMVASLFVTPPSLQDG